MNRDLYSNTEFMKLKEALSKEIQRRGTFKWWDPLVPPKVGEDRTPPITLPDHGQRMVVHEETYTINTPSSGSLETTRNITHPAHGDNPGDTGLTSAAAFNADEMRNFLVGLSKVMDIDLFYGRDEVPGTVFRNPKGIRDALKAAQESEINRPLHESDNLSTKIDPLTNEEVTYPIADGVHVMPSGEFDGEEGIPSETNFYDDSGAQQGISTHRPINPLISPKSDRSWKNRDNTPDDRITNRGEGGVPSSRFGPGPRNPSQGNEYRPRPVFGGVIGACNVACTGLCYQTCDNECSESCTTTCWNRCGNACTSTCGNICTGCSTMCYTSCKTKCEDTAGYACLNVGAMAVEVQSIGETIGNSGEPGSNTWPKNTISAKTFTCKGCAYTCQFYPNKRTTCWDTACQATCFTSCRTGCSTTCFGGCIDNDPNEGSNYKTGSGRGCSSGCTINCVGTCSGVCEGDCVQSCFQACKELCRDNCTWTCHTSCGDGCAQGCRNGCTGCSSCTGTCEGESSSVGCIGCGRVGGCTSTCQHDCNNNCIAWGCRSICGMGPAGACGANCRLSCMAASCTALCSDACSSKCTTCAFSCGFQCGPCTSQCSTGCSSDCNITCTEECQHSCTTHCYMNCTDVCGGCSNLCYSCVGRCIGICSVKCESGCSSCTNNCGSWCDSTCGHGCASNCSDRCINSCSGSCATFLQSKTTSPLSGPERPPTADGYHTPNPSNREEERESFKLNSFDPYLVPMPIEKEYKIRIFVDRDETENKDRNITIIGPEDLKWIMKSTTIIGGVWMVNPDTNRPTIIPEALPDILDQMYTPDDGNSNLFLIILFEHPDIDLGDIYVSLPWEFNSYGPIRDSRNNIVVIVEKETWKNLESSLKNKE